MRKSCHEAIIMTGDINVYIYIYILCIYIHTHTSDRHHNDFMAFMAAHLLVSYNILLYYIQIIVGIVYIVA